MREMIQELIQYRHLLFTLAQRDIKIRYKQSIMGFLGGHFYANDNCRLGSDS